MMTDVKISCHSSNLCAIATLTVTVNEKRRGTAIGTETEIETGIVSDRAIGNVIGIGNATGAVTGRMNMIGRRNGMVRTEVLEAQEVWVQAVVEIAVEDDPGVGAMLTPLPVLTGHWPNVWDSDFPYRWEEPVNVLLFSTLNKVVDPSVVHELRTSFIIHGADYFSVMSLILGVSLFLTYFCCTRLYSCIIYLSFRTPSMSLTLCRIAFFESYHVYLYLSSPSWS